MKHTEREGRSMMTRRARKLPATRPTCIFCGRRDGVQFVIFAPRFKPFGTACAACEATLPPGTELPSAGSPAREQVERALADRRRIARATADRRFLEPADSIDREVARRAALAARLNAAEGA